MSIDKALVVGLVLDRVTNLGKVGRVEADLNQGRTSREAPKWKS